MRQVAGAVPHGALGTGWDPPGRCAAPAPECCSGACAIEDIPVADASTLSFGPAAGSCRPVLLRAEPRTPPECPDLENLVMLL
ncbi:hypothetical protein GCM10027440_30960 [Nocardiopsis coralliicola]